MTWTVTFTGTARKQKGKLPEKIRELLFLLAKDIEASGPVRGGDGPTTQNFATAGITVI